MAEFKVKDASLQDFILFHGQGFIQDGLISHALFQGFRLAEGKGGGEKREM